MARPALAATRAIEVLDFLAAHPSEAYTLARRVAQPERGNLSARHGSQGRGSRDVNAARAV